MLIPVCRYNTYIRNRRLAELSKGIFAFLQQFPADLERSAGCQQSIFFLHINEQISCTLLSKKFFSLFLLTNIC